ncbi:MAG: ABC transporter permease subunit [Actinobacteria bacterium]|nr:ABC transporter permease subunit [Actinomycetota bacterium]
MIVSLGFFALLWQLASTYIVNPAILPPPTRVAAETAELFWAAELTRHMGASLKRVGVGLLLGSVSGIVVGLLVGRVRLVSLLVDPTVQFVRTLSPTAMIPIAIIWFGIGEASKYFLVFWAVFFIVAVNTTAGVVATPDTRIRAAQCLGAGSFKVFTTAVLPSTVSYILAGLRLGIASAFASIVPAEMLAAREGLGYLLQASALFGDADRIFVALVAIAALGFLSDWFIRYLGARPLRRFTSFHAKL